MEKQNKIFEECESIEAELPRWMRSYFMYLKSSVLPMTRLSYLREVKFFCNFLINETELKEVRSSIKDLKTDDFNELKSVDVNMYIDYCRRYKVVNDQGI
ncbi:MAG: recombinase, partial [Clostridia bacterium]|nr:recombinase [Clostridia bacterium]